MCFIPTSTVTIKHAVRDLAFSESKTTVTRDIQYKGTTYKKGQFLVYRSDEYMEFGKFILILIQNYVLMDIHKGIFLSEYHLYSDNGQSWVSVYQH